MLKLNVGFNRKVGEANYGSRGASVNLKLECEGHLASEPERLKDRIRSLFVLARTAVEEELNGQAKSASHGSNGKATEGRSNGHGNGRRRDSTRKATTSQARALHVIADRQGIDLAGLLRERFGVEQAGDLSIVEASGLIDELKGATNGNGQGGRR